RRREQEAQAQAEASQGLRAELEKALEHVVQLVAQRDQLTSERNDLDARLAAMTAEFAAQQSQLSEAHDTIATLRTELDRVTKLAEDHAEALQLAQESLQDLQASSAGTIEELSA